MSTLAKLLLLPALLVVGALGVALVADGPAFESDPLAASTETSPGTTTTATTRTGARVDISGPCDEPEHASDPRCAGVTVPRATGGATGGIDISGPCDELEHANDPRCTGAERPRGDNSGPGSDDDRGRGRGRGRGGDSH